MVFILLCGNQVIVTRLPHFGLFALRRSHLQNKVEVMTFLNDLFTFEHAGSSSEERSEYDASFKNNIFFSILQFTIIVNFVRFDLNKYKQ